MLRKTNNEYELLFQEFINEKQHQGLAEASIKSYVESFKRYTSETSGDFTKKSYYHWIDQFKKRGSIRSVNHYLGQLKIFINYCLKNSDLKPDQVEMLKMQQERIVYYADEELNVLLEKPDIKASFSEWRTYTIICFFLATGCRVGTLINIKLEDIDFKNKEVYYRHLKNKDMAILPLSNAVIESINRYLNIWDVKEYLFCSDSGGQMTTNSVRLALERYCKKRGIKSKGVHAFRHTFARLWCLNNGNLFALQKMLCHRDLTMTKRYANIFGSDLHNNLELYSPLDRMQNNYKVRKF